MLKILLVIISVVILFSGCHRHHGSYAVIEPAIIIKPFKSYHYNYYKRGHYKHHKHYRHHHKRRHH